jgi:hypothetical protein
MTTLIEDDAAPSPKVVLVARPPILDQPIEQRAAAYHAFMQCSHCLESFYTLRKLEKKLRTCPMCEWAAYCCADCESRGRKVHKCLGPIPEPVRGVTRNARLEARRLYDAMLELGKIPRADGIAPMTASEIQALIHNLLASQGEMLVNGIYTTSDPSVPIHLHPDFIRTVGPDLKEAHEMNARMRYALQEATLYMNSSAEERERRRTDPKFVRKELQNQMEVLLEYQFGDVLVDHFTMRPPPANLLHGQSADNKAEVAQFITHASRLLMRSLVILSTTDIANEEDMEVASDRLVTFLREHIPETIAPFLDESDRASLNADVPREKLKSYRRQTWGTFFPKWGMRRRGPSSASLEPDPDKVRGKGERPSIGKICVCALWGFMKLFGTTGARVLADPIVITILMGMLWQFTDSLLLASDIVLFLLGTGLVDDIDAIQKHLAHDGTVVKIQNNFTLPDLTFLSARGQSVSEFDIWRGLAQSPQIVPIQQMTDLIDELQMNVTRANHHYGFGLVYAKINHPMSTLPSNNVVTATSVLAPNWLTSQHDADMALRVVRDGHSTSRLEVTFYIMAAKGVMSLAQMTLGAISRYFTQRRVTNLNSVISVACSLYAQELTKNIAVRYTEMTKTYDEDKKKIEADYRKLSDASRKSNDNNPDSANLVRAKGEELAKLKPPLSPPEVNGRDLEEIVRALLDGRPYHFLSKDAIAQYPFLALGKITSELETRIKANSGKKAKGFFAEMLEDLIGLEWMFAFEISPSSKATRVMTLLSFAACWGQTTLRTGDPRNVPSDDQVNRHWFGRVRKGIKVAELLVGAVGGAGLTYLWATGSKTVSFGLFTSALLGFYTHRPLHSENLDEVALKAAFVQGGNILVDSFFTLKNYVPESVLIYEFANPGSYFWHLGHKVGNLFSISGLLMGFAVIKRFIWKSGTVPQAVKTDRHDIEDTEMQVKARAIPEIEITHAQRAIKIGLKTGGILLTDHRAQGLTLAAGWVLLEFIYGAGFEKFLSKLNMWDFALDMATSTGLIERFTHTTLNALTKIQNGVGFSKGKSGPWVPTSSLNEPPPSPPPLDEKQQQEREATEQEIMREPDTRESEHNEEDEEKEEEEEEEDEEPPFVVDEKEWERQAFVATQRNALFEEALCTFCDAQPSWQVSGNDMHNRFTELRLAMTDMLEKVVTESTTDTTGQQNMYDDSMTNVPHHVSRVADAFQALIEPLTRPTNTGQPLQRPGGDTVLDQLVERKMETTVGVLIPGLVERTYHYGRDSESPSSSSDEEAEKEDDQPPHEAPKFAGRRRDMTRGKEHRDQRDARKRKAQDHKLRLKQIHQAVLKQNMTELLELLADDIHQAPCVDVTEEDYKEATTRATRLTYRWPRERMLGAIFLAAVANLYTAHALETSPNPDSLSTLWAYWQTFQQFLLGWTQPAPPAEPSHKPDLKPPNVNQNALIYYVTNLRKKYGKQSNEGGIRRILIEKGVPAEAAAFINDVLSDTEHKNIDWVRKAFEEDGRNKIIEGYNSTEIKRIMLITYDHVVHGILANTSLVDDEIPFDIRRELFPDSKNGNETPVGGNGKKKDDFHISEEEEEFDNGRGDRGPQEDQNPDKPRVEPIPPSSNSPPPNPPIPNATNSSPPIPPVSNTTNSPPPIPPVSNTSQTTNRNEQPIPADWWSTIPSIILSGLKKMGAGANMGYTNYAFAARLVDLASSKLFAKLSAKHALSVHKLQFTDDWSNTLKTTIQLMIRYGLPIAMDVAFQLLAKATGMHELYTGMDKTAYGLYTVWAGADLAARLAEWASLGEDDTAYARGLDRLDSVAKIFARQFRTATTVLPLFSSLILSVKPTPLDLELVSLDATRVMGNTMITLISLGLLSGTTIGTHFARKHKWIDSLKEIETAEKNGEIDTRWKKLRAYAQRFTHEYIGVLPLLVSFYNGNYVTLGTQGLLAAIVIAPDVNPWLRELLLFGALQGHQHRAELSNTLTTLSENIQATESWKVCLSRYQSIDTSKWYTSSEMSSVMAYITHIMAGLTGWASIELGRKIVNYDPGA